MVNVKEFVDDKLRHGVQDTSKFLISYTTVLSLMEDLQQLLQQPKKLCKHTEVMRQGNGSVYGVCSKCYEELY